MGGPLRDRRVVITGGNSGIGLEAARALAAAGAEVVIAGRNPEKVAAAVEEVAGFVPGARLATVTVDLADLTAVAAAADELHDRFDRIDVLINNAGVMAVPLRHSADGFELHFATNHLGHFALTGQVLDLLTAAPAPRVVTVSSGMHRFADAGLANLNAENGYDKWRAYSTSKLCNLRFAFELQRRLAASGSTALSVAAHPGYAATELQRHGPRMERARVKEHAWTVFNRLFAQSARAGALPIVHAASAADVRGGDYFGPRGPAELWGRPTRVGSTRAARDPDAARRLWALSESLTGVTYGVPAVGG